MLSDPLQREQTTIAAISAGFRNAVS